MSQNKAKRSEALRLMINFIKTKIIHHNVCHEDFPQCLNSIEINNSIVTTDLRQNSWCILNKSFMKASFGLDNVVLVFEYVINDGLNILKDCYFFYWNEIGGDPTFRLFFCAKGSVTKGDKMGVLLTYPDENQQLYHLIRIPIFDSVTKAEFMEIIHEVYDEFLLELFIGNQIPVRKPEPKTIKTFFGSPK